MTTRLFVTALIFLVFLTSCISCSSKVENYQEALKLYRENKLDKAVAYFEREVGQNQNNADAFAWLAETYRRLNQHQKAADAARKALAINSNYCFAHTVLADTYNPQYSSWKPADHDTTWKHLLLAIGSDPDDGNAWLSVWIEAMRRQEDALWKKALQSMVRTKFLTPSIIAYNRWVLKQLPKNAILLTNGDMDTYPAAALQATEGLRTDVAIVNISLLNMPWYARFISKHYNIPLPFQGEELDSLKYFRGPGNTIYTPSNQIIAGWFRQKEGDFLSAPITIAATVDINSLPDTKNHLKMAGPYFLWSPKKVDVSSDTTLMRTSIEGIQPRDFTGPFVSSQDRSPIRIVSEKGISGLVVTVILDYSSALIIAERYQDASRVLDLAENIDKNYITGRMFTDEISKLREMLNR